MRWSGMGVVVALGLSALPGISRAVVAEDICRYVDGVRMCEPIEVVGSQEPPPFEFETITVVGTAPATPEWIDRHIHERLQNGQTGRPEPNVADTGGNGTEGKPSNPTTCNGTYGNPIVPATGNKLESEVEFTTGGEMPLYLERTWNHQGTTGMVFGSKWKSNFDLALEVAADGQSITALRPNGARIRHVHRTTPSVGWWEDRPEGRSRIVADGAGGYVLHASDNLTETYGAHGRVTSVRNPRGVGIALEYRTHAQHWTPLLERVTHTSGRSIQFTWTETPIGPTMTRLVDPAGNTYTYAYDAYRRLQTVTQPGTPATTITYHYPTRDATLLGKSLNGVRYSTFAYDANGRATLTEHAGGADRHSFAYTDNADGTLTVVHTNPLGKQATHQYRNGKLLSMTGHASASCPGPGTTGSGRRARTTTRRGARTAPTWRHPSLLGKRRPSNSRRGHPPPRARAISIGAWCAKASHGSARIPRWRRST